MDCWGKFNCKNFILLLEFCFRSSHWRCSVKKGVLRNFAKFARKHLCQILFFIKVAGLIPATSLKQRLWHRCFPVNFTKFLRKFFLLNTSGRILLLFYLPASNDNGITWCLVQQLLRSTELCITTIRSSKDFLCFYYFI